MNGLHTNGYSISEMFLFGVRAACELRLVSYRSKHTMQPLSDTHFVHTYMYTHTHVTWKLRVVHVYVSPTYWTTSLLSEISILWVRAVYEIRSASYALYSHKQVLQPLFWNDIFCTLTLILQKLHVVYGRWTYQMTALLLEMSICWVRAVSEI